LRHVGRSTNGALERRDRWRCANQILQSVCAHSVCTARKIENKCQHGRNNAPAAKERAFLRSFAAALSKSVKKSSPRTIYSQAQSFCKAVGWCAHVRQSAPLHRGPIYEAKQSSDMWSNTQALSHQQERNCAKVYWQSLAARVRARFTKRSMSSVQNKRWCARALAKSSVRALVQSPHVPTV